MGDNNYTNPVNNAGGNSDIPQWFGVNTEHQQQEQQQQQQRQQFAPPILAAGRRIYPISEGLTTAAAATATTITNIDQQQQQQPALNHHQYYRPQQPDPSSQNQNHPYQRQTVAYQPDVHYHLHQHQQQQLQQQQQQLEYNYPTQQSHSMQRDSRGRTIDLTSDRTSAAGGSSDISNTRGVGAAAGTSSETYNVFLDEIDNNYSQSSGSTSMAGPVGNKNKATNMGNNNRKRTYGKRISGGEDNSSSNNRSSEDANAAPTVDSITSEARAMARSERKRTREKQRRDGVNRQFAELTKVLKRLEMEEREEMERKARIAAGEVDGIGGSASSAAFQSMRLPFIAPNNSVDLVTCAIVRLNHLHNLSKRQQVKVNKLKEEINIAKKAGEETATKLKGVLFNYQIPAPNLALKSPTCIGNKPSSIGGGNNTNNNNTGMNTNNMNMNTNTTIEAFQNKLQQQPQQEQVGSHSHI